MKDDLPQVSVCTTTYNFAEYIEETIVGVVTQQVSFRYEFVIYDDCSSDETPAILRKYAERYPDIIRVFYQTANIGLNQNFMAAMQSCRGKYIALLDGDDYWTDPFKLQLQYDFLESHPDIAVCGTASLKRDEGSGTYTRSHLYLPANSGEIKVFGTPEMYKLEPFWFPTHSLLLRSRLVHFPDWFEEVVYVDRALRLILSLEGDLAFINRITCVYRVHGSNTSADRETSPEVCRGYLHTYWNFYKYSGKKFQDDAARAINHSLCEERRRILATQHGAQAARGLARNFGSALCRFQLRGVRDLAEFVYHFLFVKNLVAWIERRVGKSSVLQTNR